MLLQKKHQDGYIPAVNLILQGNPKRIAKVFAALGRNELFMGGPFKTACIWQVDRSYCHRK
jgi:hypothetical protein